MDDFLKSEERTTVEVMKAEDNMRILTIDQGNSSAKAALWRGLEPERSLRLSEMSIEGLLPLLEEGEIEGCVYSSVGHTDAKFLETLRRLVDGRLLVLTASTPLPVGVRYSGRATLGNDRVAAAAGAAFMFPGESVLVVDAGTAVTIDVISREGEFLGGNIAPGMTLRFSSLHDATDRLPLVDADGEVLAFGGDTISAIRSGVVGGMVSEVVDAFQIAERLYGCRRVVLAGYDGQRLLPLLLRRGVEASFHANLVGFGLLSIFRHNLYHKVPNDIDIKSE